MTRTGYATLVGLMCAASVLSTGSGLSQNPSGRGSLPMARRSYFVEVLPGVSIPDRYRWLEEQWSPETRSWIDAEMSHSRPLLMNLPSYPRVEKRLRELFNIDQISGIPTVVSGKLYYARRPKNAE